MDIGGIDIRIVVAGTAFAGALLGGLLGFLSNQIATSRQIATQERDKRRDVYSNYVASINDILVRVDAHEIAERKARQNSATIKAAVTGQMERSGDRTLIDRWQNASDELGRAVEANQLARAQILLYAPPVLMDSAQHVNAPLDRYLDDYAKKEPADTSEVATGLARFLILGRADGRAPGDPSLKKATKQQHRQDKQKRKSEAKQKEAERKRIKKSGKVEDGSKPTAPE